MLTGEELRYLHWLTRRGYRGRGHVVEVGPWLGGSTVALAAGLRRRSEDEPWKLHTHDNFVWLPFMEERAPIELPVGGSFRDQFRHNVREFADLLVDHRAVLPDDASATRPEATDASLPELTWDDGAPVEILFVDGAKSWSGFVHLLEVFSNALVEDALLVLQDYKYWATFWVPTVAEALGDALRPVHVLPRNTVTFRRERSWDDDALRGVETMDAVPVDRGLELLDAARTRLTGFGDRVGALVLRLAQARFLAQKDRQTRARAVFRDAERRWPLLAPPGQLERARTWIGDHAEPVSPTLRSRLRRALHRIRRL